MSGRVSRKGARFVGRWEGFRSCPYRDAVGVLTVGYGTTEAERPITGCITKRKARRWLRRSLNRKYLPAVPRRRRMRKRERDALASFAYNLGPGAVSDSDFSTLARRLRSKEGRTYKRRKRIYREEIPKWDRAGGQQLEGLTKRRRAEVRLAVHGDYSGAP